MTEKNTFKVEENALVITRVLDAPIELVYKVWSQAEHLTNWWGPKGFTMNVTKLDFQPGGKFHYSMKSPEGFEMWGLFIYGEIKDFEKIEFVNSFSNEAGEIVRAPFSETWPLEISNTLTFEKESDGKTKITLKGYPINASEEEIKTFEAGYDSMKQGFAGTFEQLEEYLAKNSSL